MNKQLLYDEMNDDSSGEDIRSTNYVDTLLDDDALESSEAGFLQGYFS
ncbi:MAG: hypothetical protein ACQESC_03680 [Nanobdellota archaeon]